MWRCICRQHSGCISHYLLSADPNINYLAGSYFIEALTHEVEEKAFELINKIDAMGGSVRAIEEGFMQNAIAHSAYEHQRQVESGDKIIVAVNKFQLQQEEAIPILRVDDSIRQMQAEKLRTLRSRRNPAKCDNILQQLNDKAHSDENIMPIVIEAVESHCTLGEIADTLREVFGEYK